MGVNPVTFLVSFPALLDLSRVLHLNSANEAFDAKICTGGLGTVSQHIHTCTHICTHMHTHIHKCTCAHMHTLLSTPIWTPSQELGGATLGNRTGKQQSFLAPSDSVLFHEMIIWCERMWHETLWHWQVATRSVSLTVEVTSREFWLELSVLLFPPCRWVGDKKWE